MNPKLPCGVSSASSYAELLPQAGHAVDILALGRSGSAISGRTRVGAIQVLVEPGRSPIRPVEGELFTLDVSRRTRENGFWLLEGSIHSPRLSEKTLRLEPLALIPRAIAGPGEDASANELRYELETIIPRVPGFRVSGPAAIDEIAAFCRAGERELAELLAGELLARDLRCLEAHALLGGFHAEAPLEERWTERALRHYRVGVRIGELSLPEGFEGLLPWCWNGNRAFLRCLHGYGRCLARLGAARPAEESFARLLALAPEHPLPRVGT